jgi:hypothetical protein
MASATPGRAATRRLLTALGIALKDR